jgi:hypothetical protein
LEIPCVSVERRSFHNSLLVFPAVSSIHPLGEMLPPVEITDLGDGYDPRERFAAAVSTLYVGS